MKLSILLLTVVIGVGCGENASKLITGQRDSLTIERELDKWRPDSLLSNLPASVIACSDCDLRGEWYAGDGLMEKKELSISGSDIRNLIVVFRSAGEFSSPVSLSRTGRFTDGLLRFNRPVREYSMSTYQQLQVVKSGDTVALLAVTDRSRPLSVYVQAGCTNYHVLNLRRPTGPIE